MIVICVSGAVLTTDILAVNCQNGRSGEGPVAAHESALSRKFRGVRSGSHFSCAGVSDAYTHTRTQIQQRDVQERLRAKITHSHIHTYNTHAHHCVCLHTYAHCTEGEQIVRQRQLLPPARGAHIRYHTHVRERPVESARVVIRRLLRLRVCTCFVSHGCVSLSVCVYVCVQVCVCMLCAPRT